MVPPLVLVPGQTHVFGASAFRDVFAPAPPLVLDLPDDDAAMTWWAFLADDMD